MIIFNFDFVLLKISLSNRGLREYRPEDFGYLWKVSLILAKFWIWIAKNKPKNIRIDELFVSKMDKSTLVVRVGRT